MFSFILIIAIVNLALGYGLAIYLGRQGLAIGAGSANFPSWQALSSRLRSRKKQAPPNGNVDTLLAGNPAEGLPFPEALPLPGPAENELGDDAGSEPFDLSADDSPFRPLAAPPEENARPAAPPAAALPELETATADPIAAGSPQEPANDLPPATESPDFNSPIASEPADATPPAEVPDSVADFTPAPPNAHAEPGTTRAAASSLPAAASPIPTAQPAEGDVAQALEPALDEPEEQLAEDARSLAAETEAVVSDPEMLAGIEAFRAQLAEMHQQPSD